jgi:hypothetical protein
MNYTIVVMGGVLLLSLVWYYLPVVGGVHWFNGPRATIVPTTYGHDNDGTPSESEGHKTADV